MASVVDICNFALSYLGDSATLASVDPPEGSAQADHLARFYPLAVEEALSEAAWTFATVRKALAPLAVKAPGYSFAYALPADCLRVIALDSAADWTIDCANGLSVLLTDSSVEYARYVSSSIPSARFSPTFVEALAHLLASKIAGALVPGQSGQKTATDQRQLYELALRRAITKDSDQVSEPRPTARSLFVGDYEGD